ncbi:polysaccharide pyruvyl transferase family protein [Desulfobulbus elongatus]|uniref:polysaccharide pyruvyl transferase family protein n=1 Tax=Desulfobulbus elongatus TaxID=53332 RepID=UPI0004840D60|nr:polysaccharide pyruvyl transferase family protein [Desulfobulbus elongatus]
MNILIIEAYSAANIGSGALVENSVRLLKENFPGANIEVLAQTPESIHKLTGLPCAHELISLPLGQSRPRQMMWLLRTGLWMTMHALAVFLRGKRLPLPESLYTFDADTLAAIQKIKAADMVVSVGAERINDNFYKAILFSLYMLWVVQTYKKYLVLFPQTIGPFHFRATRFLSKKILNTCDVLFLRDQKSGEIVKEMGISGPVIVNTCDVAVLQPAVDPEEARGLLNEFNVPEREQPLVGMSVMRWSYIKAQGTSGYEEYKRAIATVADEFIGQKGVRVLFIATNVLVEGCREDDVAAARDIMALMRNKDEATILGRVYSPAQMKGIMGLLDLCLVTRMHACIFSTGICTPTAAINYQFKLEEYMRLMGLGEYTVDIDKVTTDNLRALMERAWADRSVTREILKSNITAKSANLKAEMARLPEYYAGKTDERDCAEKTP